MAGLEPAIGVLRQLQSTEHALEGLLGTIYHTLDRRDQAVAAFHSMTRPQLTANLVGSGFDLDLVGALIAGGEPSEECRRYLQLISERAKDEKDMALLRRVRDLLIEIESITR